MIELRESIERLVASLPARDPGEVIREISRLATASGEDACNALLAAHPELLDHVPALTAANVQRVRQSDAAEVEKLLQIRPNGPVVIGDMLSERGWRPYARVSDLFEQVALDKCRRLVMIGCGPYPSTIFHIYDKTEIPEIIGLDTLPYAIDTVLALIEQLGLSRIKAELSDGRRFDYAGVDVVFLANMVSPKAAVLSRIADTAPADVQIVLRDPYALGILWAESGERCLDPRLEVISRAQPIGDSALSRDVFIRRRTGAR
jgi:hypothetical protein